MVKTEISTQSTSPNKLGKSIFTRLLVTLLKLNERLQAFKGIKKVWEMKYFAQKTTQELIFPATKYMFNVIKNEIKKMYN